MVRILSIVITTLAAVSPVAQAGACVPGLQYCGSTLKDYGYNGAKSLHWNTLYQCNSDGDWKLMLQPDCLEITYSLPIVPKDLDEE
ncbi:hypothetical protein E4U52_004018 [Claviceps spartinae]|nr:hypothetical protein E4U52_004018 [Claviceps spartinae]